MSLSQIDLRPVYKHRYQAKFSPEAWCIPELYWSFLKNYSIENVQKINIIVSDEWKDQVYKLGSVPGFREINMPFDFQKYFTLDIQGRKLMQLDVVHNGMMKLAEKEGWEVNPLLDAYNGCLEKDLKYEFFVSSKTKLSPDRKYGINFWCEWELESCKLFWVLYDKKRQEQTRELLIQKGAFQGQFVYYIKFKWINNSTVMVESKFPKKELYEINLEQGN